MSEPHYPQHPGWGMPPPQPPRKRTTRKILAFTAAGAIAAFLVGGALSVLTKDDGRKTGTATVASEPPRSEPTTSEPAEVTVSPECRAWFKEELQDSSESIDAVSGYAVCGELSDEQMDAIIDDITQEIRDDPTALAEATKTQAEKFQDCVAETGTASEKTAVKHVTKVTGTDDLNNIADAAEVFTDFTGGMLGPHQGDGKLIASAFSSCYESDNGLVTVYDKDGELLATGNW